MKSKLDVFARSYDEVLAALKHQDDKLNRTLTALAFLTAAGVALFVSLERSSVRGGPVYFPEHGASVTAVMFVVFLAAVTMALLTALAGIGPGTPLRRSPGGDNPKPSLLFYEEIARDGTWDKAYGDETLEVRLSKDLHEEARSLSHRVNYKVARSRESGAFVQLAILSLTLLGIFGAGGLNESARWWSVSALVVLVLASPFWELWLMHKHKYEDAGWSMPYTWLAVAVALTAGLLVAGELTEHHWHALYYALFVMLLSRLSLLSGGIAKVLLPIAVAPGVPLLVIALAS